MLRLKVFIVRNVIPLLVMYAVAHQNERLLVWSIVDLPTMLAANTDQGSNHATKV